jgi:hypothetical protein
LVVLSLALHGSVWQGQAQVYTLSDANSVARIDLSNPNPGLVGMFDWSVQGSPSQLRQQWFWFRVGPNPENPINTISPPAFFGFLGTRGLVTTYANAAFSIEIDYLLTGGSFVPPGGLAQSDIQETIRIHNTSGGPLDFHFYQYSDFDLAGAGNDSITLGTDPGGRYNSANQSDGISTLTESVTVNTPSASHGEANFFNATWVKLNNGAPDILNDNATAGPGNVTWALQWDVLLNPNDTFIISKDKRLQVAIPIPEPSSFLLLPLGAAAFAFIRRRNRK